MEPFKLPKGFLLGSATAGAQIDGGDTNSNWTQWCRKGKIRDGSTTLTADDHWNRVESDTALLTELNQKIYRMSIEWSRIEPQKGKFDAKAMAHYRNELSLIVRSGIRPLVTLHHFTHPLWLCGEGDFESPTIVAYFERYVRYVVENIGDLVSEYVTINEPSVYITNGYVFGAWPPGKKDIRMAIRVYINMAKCHIAAYHAIHELRRGLKGKTRVGVSSHLRVFTALNRLNPLDHLAAGILSHTLQDNGVRLFCDGTISFPWNLLLSKEFDGKGHYFDFIGINYYTRSSVSHRLFHEGTRRNAPLNDLGWEIYPEGISTLCERFYKKFRIPVWITENGICDNTDAYRAEFICSHLSKVAESVRKGVGIERYYHWSLLDNFEWLDGESARFGLVHVNYHNQHRTIKRSARLYAGICKYGELTQDMIDDFESGANEENEIKIPV